MAAKTSWHRYGTKLRDCHPMSATALACLPARPACLLLIAYASRRLIAVHIAATPLATAPCHVTPTAGHRVICPAGVSSVHCSGHWTLEWTRSQPGTARFAQYLTTIIIIIIIILSAQ